MNLRECLYKSVSKSLSQCNIKAIFQSKNQGPHSLISSIPAPSYLQFQCSNDNITYYSETERHLKVRAGGHISTSPLTRKSVINNKENLLLKMTVFCQVTCVHLMILPSWIMSHTSLKVWLKNLYLLPRINHYWRNKWNHWNLNSFDSIPLALFYYIIHDL